MIVRLQRLIRLQKHLLLALRQHHLLLQSHLLKPQQLSLNFPHQLIQHRLTNIPTQLVPFVRALHQLLLVL